MWISTQIPINLFFFDRHEKVQENCIELVGRIADRGSEFVSAREWMRICFELLELLKAHKKSIRRAAINTFGYIAKVWYISSGIRLKDDATTSILGDRSTWCARHSLK